MTTAFYRTGTVAVTQNSKVVTGTGTNWTTGPTKPLAGDVFIFNNKMYEIDSVVSDTEIRLYRNFEDSTASSKSYAIMRNASLNISARIAAQVAQVVNQKQIMIDEFHDFLTNNTDSTVPLTDTLGNKINVTPIPMLDEIYNQATKGLNDKADEVINSQRARSEADMNQMRKQNDEIFDASGMVQMGNSSSANGRITVNEGITCFNPSVDNFPNAFMLGETGGSASGNSKTGYALTNIANFISKLRSLGVSWGNAYMKLPPAPKGYDVADSTGNCRGSGKAVLNLRTEVDPKYGDIADSDEEAISRAWEAGAPNGDFRFGKQTWRESFSVTYEVNSGVAEVTCGGNSGGRIEQYLGEYVGVAGVELTVVLLNPTTNTTGARIAIGGDVTADTIIPPSDKVQTVTVTSTSANDGYFRVYPSTLGNTQSITVYSVSIKPVTEEVITNPVDLTGLEGFLREVSTTNPFVYPGGIIQSKATIMNGIATSRSNRPDSYYAVYTGDTSSAGLGVNFFAANVFDQGKMLADESNNLFKLADGRLVQFCIRNRTIRGAGNGDWGSIDYKGSITSTGAYQFWFNSNSRLKPQGDRDSIPSSLDKYNAGEYGGSSYYVSAEDTNDTGSKTISKGICSARGSAFSGDSDYAVSGECYWLTLATIPRLNQGAFCKGLNEFGTAKWNDWDGTNNNSKFWHEHNNFKTKADCFNLVSGGTVGVVGGAIVNGASWTGRPDGKYHDAIYPSGLNGVIDHRLPAKHMEDDWLDPKQKLESAKFRGAQKLVWTGNFIVPTTTALDGNSAGRVLLSTSNVSGDKDWLTGTVPKPCLGSLVIAGVAYKVIGATYSGANNPYVDVRLDTQTTFAAGVVVQGGALSTEINTTVSGEYSVDTVVGDPINLMQVDVLKDGFLGYWCDVIPEIGVSVFPLSRKALLSGGSRTYSNDLGTSWVNGSTGHNNDTNTLTTGVHSNNGIGIYSHTAYAFQTEEAVNSPIVGGEKGVSRDVFSTMSYLTGHGVLLGESLTGNIQKSSGNPFRRNYSLTELYMDSSEKFNATDPRWMPKHSELTLPEPSNDSPAVKVQYSLVEENGQLFIQLQANELGWKDLPATMTPISGSVSQNLVQGTLYRITIGVHQGKIVQCKLNLNGITFDSIYLGLNGEWYTSNGTVYTQIELYETSDGWGDDGTIKITADGSDTFVDRNGITRKSVCHRTKFPIGWARTAAKVGSENSPA